jgi:hypothetical protein
MKEKNLSVKDVSIELCVTERAVYLWLSDKRKIPLIAQKLFSMLYDIPFSVKPTLINNETPLLFDFD